MRVSVIIPTYNEEKVIGDCLKSLEKQSWKNLEIIVVDDGSADRTFKILSDFKFQNSNFKVFKQEHLGPGMARNLGAKHAEGEILVFVDADMTFDKDFIEKLTEPIRQNKVIGTFSKEEYVENKENVWSKCWNLNKGLPPDRMHPKNYPDQQPVFRAILKKKFEETGGFRPIGYIDDYTLAESLGVLAEASPGAIFYHKNPASLIEVYQQARWIGKSEYKRRKIKNELLMRLAVMARYSLPFTIANGLVLSLRYGLWQFLIFKIVYDIAIEISLVGSLLGEQAYK